MKSVKSINFFKQNLKMVMEVIHGELKKNGNSITVKKIRKFHYISSSDHSQISFIFHSLRYLEKLGILTSYKRSRLKQYYINFGDISEVDRFLSNSMAKNQDRKEGFNREEPRDKKNKMIKGIPLEVIESFLFHVDDVEDFSNNISLSNNVKKNGYPWRQIEQSLFSIRNIFHTIFTYVPDLQEQILQTIHLDLQKIYKKKNIQDEDKEDNIERKVVNAIKKAKDILLEYLE